MTPVSRVLALLCVTACGTPETPPSTPAEPPDSAATADSGDEVLPPTLPIAVTVTLDGAPIGGATVVQPGAELSWTTDADGAVVVDLDTTIIGRPALTASHPDARVAGDEMRWDSLPEAFEIELVSFDPGDNPLYIWQDSGTPDRFSTTNYCAHCHRSFVDDWWASPHRSATSNVVVQDLYAGVATAWSDAATCASAGGTVRDGLEPGTGATTERCYVGAGTLPDLNEDCGDTESCDGVAEHTGACADCHAPALSGELGGRDLLEADALAHETGIGCDVCHKVESVDLESHAPGVAGRLVVVRPSEESTSLAFGDWAPLTFGPYDDVLNPRMGSVYREHFENGEVCSGCHQYDQAVLVPGASIDSTRWPDGRLPVHSTWDEKQDGPLADVSCNSCHMPPMTETGNGADLGNYIDASDPDIATGWYRPPGDVRRHSWYGPRSPDERMIDLAASLSLEVDAGTDAVEVAVTATNVGPAHALPTGEPLRHMLLVVEATCAGEVLSATGGDVIPDFGGLVAEKGSGEDWSQWDSAAVGDRVRVLGWDGDWYDYTGHGPFGDGSFDAEAKGMPVLAYVGEVEITALNEGVATFDDELPEGDRAWLVRDSGALPAEGDVPADLAGRPGFGFARVMVGPDGARMVPHFLAVDVASDNRLLPSQSHSSAHRFGGCAAEDTEVTARLVYRRLPSELAAERGWELSDLVMQEARWDGGAP